MSLDGSDRRRAAWRRGLVAAALVGASVIAIVVFDPHRLLLDLRDEHRDAIAWVAENNGLAVSGYLLVYTLMVALSVPGSVWLTVTGGVLFGVVLGSALTVVAATVGATIVFLGARYVAGDWVRAKAARHARRLEGGFRRNAFSYLLVLRLVPLVPFWVVNLVSALLGVPLRTYVIGTLVGILPASIVFASLGDGLAGLLDAGGSLDATLLRRPELWLPLLGLAGLALLPVLLGPWLRRWRGGDA